MQLGWLVLTARAHYSRVDCALRCADGESRGGHHDVAGRATRPASDGSRAARLPASPSRPPDAEWAALCAKRTSHSVTRGRVTL